MFQMWSTSDIQLFMFIWIKNIRTFDSFSNENLKKKLLVEKL